MLKKILASTALAVGLVAIPSVAAAEDGWSWRVFGGATDPNEEEFRDAYGYQNTLDLDTGWVIGGALGTTFGPLTLEGELSYRSADGDITDNVTPYSYDTDVTSAAFLINAWYNFGLGGPIDLYLGGGVGVGNIEAEITAAGGGPTVEIDDFGAVWQLGGGLHFNTDGPISYGVGYRYVTLPTIDSNIVGSEDIEHPSTNEIVFELRSRF